MQKLVIEYYISGDWGSSHYVVRCCEYESDADFLIHFEEKLKEKIDEYEKYKKKDKEWLKFKDKMDFTLWCSQRPELPDEHFEVGLLKFNIDNFFHQRSMDNKY